MCCLYLIKHHKNKETRKRTLIQACVPTAQREILCRRSFPIPISHARSNRPMWMPTDAPSLQNRIHPIPACPCAWHWCGTRLSSSTLRKSLYGLGLGLGLLFWPWPGFKSLCLWLCVTWLDMAIEAPKFRHTLSGHYETHGICLQSLWCGAPKSTSL